MRAVAITEQSSGPEVIDIPTPTPGDGQVLVQVQASSLNGFDIAVANGMLVGMMEHRYPVVLGKDFAGVVEAVGKGSDRFAVGDVVFGVVMTPYVGEGAHAEYLVVGDQYGIAAIPEGVGVEVAGALGLAGAAALGVLDALDLQPGKTVLVVGATGGVGSIVTEYAAAAGARVIATAQPGTEAAFVREHGATDVVDPQGDLAAEVTSIAPAGVDAIAHLAGEPSALLGLLAPTGRLASTLGFGAEQHPSAVAVMANPDAATLERLARDVAGGRGRITISATFALADVPAAVAAFPQGTLGKQSVRIS